MSAQLTPFWVVIPAAGSARRMGSGNIPKQYLPLAGSTVLERAIAPFLARPDCKGVVVVLAADDERWRSLAISSNPRVSVAVGGSERIDSVRAGFDALAQTLKPSDWVLVHDAARPCLHGDDLARLLECLRDDEVGGLLAAPVVDTLKRADEAGRVVETVDRTELWRALTPQMFRFDVLRRALDLARERRMNSTDEAQAVEALGLQPRLVDGSADNIKVTIAEDFVRAERILASGEHAMTPLRIGQGYDVHVFEAGDHVTLGGVRIAHSQGIRAHSDGDVLLHALCDALLGAAALGDIGMHFPDTDPRWRGADSRVFLRHVKDLLVQRSFAIVNVDATLIAEAPRLGKHRETMCANIAADLGIALDRVNVKATTSEGAGFIGRREGLACHAIALIELEPK